MASGKKANTWHFGMKEHIAACSESGIIYGTVAAPANEHDITHLGDLLKGLEKMVFLDSGYIGCATSAASIPQFGSAAAVFVQTLLSLKSPPSTSHSALHLVKERHHMGVHHLLGKPNELPATLFTPVIATD